MKKDLKQIGVFMDHAEARLLEPNQKDVQIISSNITTRERIKGESGDGTRMGNNRSTNNEVHKHNKEQNELHAYFKNLAEHLKPFDEIFIFGPTTAQHEFHNYLVNEKKLPGKRTRVEKANYMTDNQMMEFVKKHFKEMASHHA